ncbi:MAG: metallophosphoesterase [Cyanobacteria bacterium J06632_22]
MGSSDQNEEDPFGSVHAAFENAMPPFLTGPLTVESFTLAIRDLPAALAGTTVVQLSDFHYDGLRLSEWMLDEVSQRVAEISPDLILLTGDFITADASPIYPLARWLETLPSRAGSYAVIGNHELYRPGSRATVTHALERAGIPVLWNQVLYPLGESLALVGLADLWSRAFDPAPVMDSLDPAVPRLVMAHNPDSATALAQWRVDLQLSGHTHGGQIYLPGLGSAPQLWDRWRKYIPASWRKGIPYLSDECMNVIRNWEWAMGLHQVGENRLYVNRGLGTYLPGRLFCPPELTVITLECQA